MRASDKTAMLAAAALLFLSSFSVLQAQESRLTVSAEDLAKVSEAENNLKQLLDQEFDDGNPLLSGREPRMMSGQQAVMSGLEKNLTLRKGRLDDTVAEAVLSQARAVFDPVLTLSLAFDRTQVNTRIENASRFQSATTVNDQGENVLEISEVLDPRAPVIVFTEPREEGFEDSRVLASQEPITGTDEVFTLGAGLDQSLPWGGSFRIAYSAINKDTFYINNPQLFSGNSDPPRNLIGFGSYDRPWVSELLAGIEMPLPGMRNYGPYSEQVLNRDRAILGRESSAFATRELINDTLLAVDAAWWGLVEAALIVQTVRESRIAAEALLDSTNRLYRARSANNYDLSQAELSLANTRQREQQAWSSYIAASDSLVNLLDMDPQGVIVPEGFAETLGLEENIAEYDDSVTKHPEFLAQKAQNGIARLDSESGEQGVKPDLTFNAEINFRQSNQVYGYESLADSLGSVFDPDVTTLQLGVAYTRPWGNRAATAVADEAAAGYRQSSLSLKARQHQLTSDLASAEAILDAALINTGYRAEASRLAESAYEKALSQQRNRSVREYELAGQHARLLQARLAYISSLVAVKKAKTAVLDARGVLHSHYAGEMANSEFEKTRLALLGQQGIASLFVAGEEQ